MKALGYQLVRLRSSYYAWLWGAESYILKAVLWWFFVIYGVVNFAIDVKNFLY